MQSRTTLRFLLIIAASFATLQTAHADVVLSAQSVVSAPTAIGLFTFDRTIDQSGLTMTYVSGTTDFATYVAGSPTHVRNNTPPNYAAAFTFTPFDVDYALGGTYGVNQLALWNYPFAHSAGLDRFEVYTSNDAGFTSSTLVGSFNALDDGDTFLNSVQVFDVTDSSAAYVRIHALSTFQGNAGGFSEIAFGVDATTQNVPEPAAPALILVGLLSAALVRRGRAS